MKRQGLAGARRGWQGLAGVLLPLLTLTYPFSPLLTPAFSAEELRVGAQVDRTEVATGQVLTYSITIAGPIQEPPKVELNRFEGFQVVSTGQSQQIQVGPRRTEQALTLTYSLAPTAPGTHTLGPVKVEYQGKTYETHPIVVKVVEGPAVPERGPAPQRRPSRRAPRQKKVPQLEGGVVL